MKYHIKISGGFAGFVEEYTGEIDISKEDQQNLLVEIRKAEERPKNEMLRDTLSYEVSLDFEGQKFNAAFDDYTLSDELYQFINKIKKRR